jgi:hypothetical protein
MNMGLAGNSTQADRFRAAGEESATAELAKDAGRKKKLDRRVFEKNFRIVKCK